jgi:hypothetical protein
MKTNELKKGVRVRLRNGWEATIKDNMRGNTRLAEVYGYHTETGSVYAHDIEYVINEVDDNGHARREYVPVEHTKAQLKLKAQVNALFGGN